MLHDVQVSHFHPSIFCKQRFHVFIKLHIEQEEVEKRQQAPNSSRIVARQQGLRSLPMVKII